MTLGIYAGLNVALTRGMEHRLTHTQTEWHATAMRRAVQRWLLACGVASSALYTVMLIIVPMRWAAYHSAAYTVSELSAIDAPTRSLWLGLADVWTLLYVAFGIGVFLSNHDNRALRALGGVLVISGVFGFFWPPMHQRVALAAGGKTLTDTLHIVWTIGNAALTLFAMVLGAVALSKRFRAYSIATMLTLTAAGILTSSGASRVEANLPTPWIGVWERINIGAWLLWIALLALVLWRRVSATSGLRRD